MKIEISNVKGFQDFLPPESLKREAVRKVIEKNFKLYGFLPVETPIIEYDELMRPDILPNEEQDEAVSDRFRLNDRGGRNLGLRYEFTFQLSKIFKQNPTIKLPFRRYQVGPLFRDEPISANRFRQFTQCDADIIGDSSINADAECLNLVSDILKDFKIDSEIHVNNRKLLVAIIESVEIKDTKNVMRELDKIDKIEEFQVKSNLKKYALTNQIMTLFKLLEKDITFFKENAFDGAGEVLELIQKCRENKIDATFNPFMIRGLGYYTGSIFEVKEPGKPAIAGGGRYDKVVGKYLNQDIPAVGISFGLERMTTLANITPEQYPQAIIVSLSQDRKAQMLAKKLRKTDISCTIAYGKPGKQLEYANTQGIPYTIFIGGEEAAQKKFKLKNMKSGDEKLMTEKQLLNEIKK